MTPEPVAGGGDSARTHRAAWWVHTCVAVAYAGGGWALLANLKHGGHVLPAAFFVGLFLVVAAIASTAVLWAWSRSTTMTWKRLAFAHIAGALPLLLIAFLGLAQFALERYEDVARCGRFSVSRWRLVPSGAGEGSMLEVDASSTQFNAARLDFVMHWDRTGEAASEHGPDEAPMVPIPMGASATLRHPMRAGRIPDLLQFALCGEPGTGTESCAWFGFGDTSLHQVHYCPTPASAAPSNTPGARQ